eukprot:6807000-Lingulodinium_polyedra.AAC.1
MPRGRCPLEPGMTVQDSCKAPMPCASTPAIAGKRQWGKPNRGTMHAAAALEMPSVDGPIK